MVGGVKGEVRWREGRGRWGVVRMERPRGEWFRGPALGGKVGEVVLEEGGGEGREEEDSDPILLVSHVTYWQMIDIISMQ